MGDGNLARAKKNAKARKAWLIFQDESGISQRPPVRRQWAPKGETPTLTHYFNWKKLSMSAALAYRWDGARTRLYCDTIAGSYNDSLLIEFLKRLKSRIRSNAILIWDGLPAHRSRPMSEYLLKQSNWLHVERLPGYAPDLNPVELLWGNVKGAELANLCVDNLGQAEAALREGMSRVRKRPDLLHGFLNHTGVSF